MSNVQFEEEGTERGGEAVNGDIDYRTYSEAEEECYGGYKEVVQEKDNGDGGLDDCF